MFNFSTPEIGLIVVIALMVFGPGKLPETGKAIGKGIAEFRRAVAGDSSNAIHADRKHEEKG